MKSEIKTIVSYLKQHPELHRDNQAEIALEAAYRIRDRVEAFEKDCDRAIALETKMREVVAKMKRGRNNEE